MTDSRSTTARSSSWRTPTTRCSGRRAPSPAPAGLILAYEALPGRPDITAGRQAALARFPRAVESLRLAETAAFGAAAWPEPVETAEGLAVAAGPARCRASTPPPTAPASPSCRDRLRPALAGAAHGDHPRPLGRVRPRGPRAAVPRRRGAPRRARLRALGAGLRQRPLGGADAAQPRPARAADPADADRPGAGGERSRRSTARPAAGPGSTTTPGPRPRSSTRCCPTRRRARRRAAAQLPDDRRAGAGGRAPLPAAPPPG